MPGGGIDPNLEAALQTESRHPHHEPEPPASFRRQQLWVAVAIAVIVLGGALYLVWR
jgi:hypothetical protein